MRYKLLDRVGFLGLASCVFLWGYVQGYVFLSVQFKFSFIVVAFGYLQAVVSTVSFTAFIAVSGLLFLWKSVETPSVRRTGQPTLEEVSGSVAAIVPVYRDENVLHRSVNSLLDSGFEDLTVYIVCESDDTRAIERAHELANLDRVEYIINEDLPGSKAGAINEAVRLTDSEYVGVFDADELVHPEFVSTAVGKLQNVEVVQGRTVPEPTGIVESMVYYESLLLSYVARRLLYVFTGFRMAASRVVLMRRSTLESLGGYDESMVTEDFDFAYRCYRNHVSVAEDLQHPSRIDAAHTMRDWWGQRKRWMSGYAQVLHRLVGNLLSPRSYRDVLSVVICASTLGGSLLCLSIISKFAVLVLLGLNLFVVLPLATIVAVTLVIRLQDASRGFVDSVGWSWVLVPLVFPLYSLAAIKALLEYVTTWDGTWYRVDKRA